MGGCVGFLFSLVYHYPAVRLASYTLAATDRLRRAVVQLFRILNRDAHIFSDFHCLPPVRAALLG
jgi:hypothetical protein